MSASYQSEKTVIGRLRVRGAGIDPALARLRLTSLLNTVAFRPSGLAPSALVVIKEMRDPLPGRFGMQQQAGTRPPPDWERAVGSLLEQLLRRAGRPALSHVDDGAEAVIFLDRSELLACLASDWYRTGTLRRWWWQSLLGSPDLASTIVRMWLEAAEYIPAALDHLVKRREAVPFLRAMKATDTRLLLSGVIRSFALRKLEPLINAAPDANNYATGDELKEGRAERVVSRSGGELTRPVATRKPPWQPIAREIEGREGLDLYAECLLGIGVMLQRAPSVVRSESFARDLFSWRRSFVDESPVDSLPAELRRTVELDKAEGMPKRRAVEAASATPAEPASPMEVVEQGLEAAARAPSSEGMSPRAAQDEEAADVSITQDETKLFSPQVEAFPEGIFESPEYLQELEGIECETEFGGLFYLINLGIFLGLYGDFTTPAECDPSLSIWDFVALLGRELLGREIESDPLWPLLAAFAGRARHEAPGENFAAPDSWRMPPHWLEPYSERCTWRWTSAGGRLRVTHARGFTVLDVPLTEEDAAAQHTLELRNYECAREFEFEPEPSGDEPAVEPLHRWLNWLMPYARVRLAQALGLSFAEDVPRVLCAHRARIIFTATHLDIFLSLAELPVGVRLSGLDRDPGWVPAAGKFISFHFE